MLFGKRFLLVSTLMGCSALLNAGEAEPPKPETKPAPAAVPLDTNQIIDSIPLVPLADGVMMQSGEIKVPTEAIEKVELAYVATERRHDAKFVLNPDTRSFMRKRFAFRFLANALVEKYVSDNKLEMPKEQFEEQFLKFKNAKKEEESGSYEQWLADNGLNDDEFRRFWCANWTIEQTLAKTISEEDVTKTMEQFKDNLGLRMASHILVLYRGTEPIQLNVARGKEEAKKKADEIEAQLKAGEDFGRLARTSSDCPSKAAGGVLGSVSRKGGPSEVFGVAFSDAVYKLEKPGDYTPVPIESKFGYHIIRLDEIRKPEDMRKDIRQHLVSEKYRKQMEQLMNNAIAGARFNVKQL